MQNAEKIEKNDELSVLSLSYNIPPQPQILIAIQKNDRNIDSVAKLISQDLALSSAVLKTINSSYMALILK